MNYEVITLEEKVVAGIEARTNNNSPDMGMVIGGLWNHFYQDGIYESIPNKSRERRWQNFGRSFGKWICQGLISAILKNTRMTPWKNAKSISILV